MNAEQWLFFLAGNWPGGPIGGLLANLFLFVGSLAGGWLIAVPMALARMAAPLPFRWVTGLVVESARSTPLLLLVFWMHFLLPLVTDEDPDPWWSAIIALLIHSAAYQTEILRAGFGSVPSNEVETALASGMNRFQSAIHVVIPQGFRRILPSWFSFAVSLFKDTAVVYVIGVVDLMQAGLIGAERHPDKMLFYYLLVGAGFFIMGSLLTMLGHRIERHTHVVS